MKNLFILLTIVLTGCNNVMSEEGEKVSQDSIAATDTSSHIDKLNDVINQNREADDSIKNVENIEQQLKDTPKP